MKKKIAVIGTTFVDCKGFVNGLSGDYDAAGRNTGNVKFVHGGVGRNVAENLSGLGDEVYFVSSIDDTALSEEICERLRKNGTNLDYVVKAKNNAMGTWIVILDVQGEQVGSLSAMPDVSIVEKVLKERGENLIKSVDGIAAEIDMSESVAAWTVKMAKKYNKPLYALTGNLNVLIKHPEYLSSFSGFVCNQIEIGKLFDFEPKGLPPHVLIDILKGEMQRLIIPRLVVTLGSKGAVYVDILSGASGYVPSIPTQVKDVSGAGDGFFSGTVHALMKGKSLKEAVEMGTKLATLTIQNDENCCNEILNGIILPWMEE